MPAVGNGLVDTEAREVVLGAARGRSGNKVFPSNAIKTSKYTVANFFPKNVWEQLHKAANAYFLLISFIMFLGNHTPLFTGTINFLATFMTLVIMMSFSAVIAALDDRQRHLADAQANSQLARRVVLTADGPKGESVQWKDIAVGDVLVIKGGEDFPSDLVPLACPGEEGECHVSTANLDGETNLKVKQAVEQIQNLLCGPADHNHNIEGVVTPSTSLNVHDPLLTQVLHRLAGVQGAICAEAPQRSIHNFMGLSRLSSPDFTAEEALGPQHLLLRGTQLRNTAWCVGLVIYTGRQTRMSMNSVKAPSKYANLEKTINVAMIVVVGSQALMALISSLVYNSLGVKLKTYWYLTLGAESLNLLPDGLAMWLTFFVLYSNLMPISLYATMEVCNVLQASFIRNDLEMYDEEQDTAASARATNLGHELGQVSYIFSDKTGTLTQNIMELKRVSIAGEVYGHVGGAPGFHGGPEVAEARRSSKRTEQAIDSFLEILAVSHTVMAVPTNGGGSVEVTPGEVESSRSPLRYEAESPDEAALVEAAAGLGWPFVGRHGGTAVVEVGPPGHGKTRKYEVLALNAFNSYRKRTSVVVRTESGQILLLAKGADNIMLQRAAQIPDRTQEHLTAFAKEGLRTLVLGRRLLADAEFNVWYETYTRAQALLSGRAEALEAVAENIEVQMDILGVTAIEDKLQVGVVETIVSVREAGIKLWVLTGDKLETAQNIGFSTRVLTEDMMIFILDVEHTERHQITTRLAEVSKSADAALKHGGTTALLVTGQALEAISEANSNGTFFEMAMRCSVVIACRVSPSQKALLVTLVRKRVRPAPVTLAIGDGANDVPMIQAAQVGVGIAGREGRQAANSADFAIAQFRYLKRLLLVHGRWNYRRACKFTLYSFWKNAVCVLLMFYYVFTTGYAGTSLFEDMIRASYNIVLAFPIIATGIFDRDISAEDAFEHPELYETGRKGLDLNSMKLIECLLSAAVHSIVIMCVLKLSYKQFSYCGAGDYYTFGTAVFTWLVIAMNYRVAFLTTTWNWVSLAAQAIAFLKFILLLIGYCLIRFDPNIFNPWMYWVPMHMVKVPAFWFCAAAVPAVAMVIDVFKAYLVLEFRPDQRDLILENARSRRFIQEEPCEGRAAVGHAPSGVSMPSPCSSFNFDHPGSPPRHSITASLHRAATDTSFVDDLPHGAVRAQRSSSDGRPAAGEGAGRLQNRPLDWALVQQRLPSWQFVLSWRKVLAATLTLGTLLLFLGLAAWLSSLSESELWVQYDGSRAEGGYGSCPVFSNGTVNVCDLSITVPRDMQPPVVLFYAVSPFHQNNPAYMQSVVSEQLQGRWGSGEAVRAHCPRQTRIDGNGRRIFPCGLQATSIFNDTFEVLDLSSGTPLPVDRSGLAWRADLDRYRNPEGFPDQRDVSWLPTRYPASIASDGVGSEAFAVWMRPAALPQVLKPYGRLSEGFSAGQQATIRVSARFPVRSVGAAKHIVIKTASAFGSSLHEFSLFFIGAGMICWACAAAVMAIRVCCPRAHGKPRHFRCLERRRLAWQEKQIASQLRGCWLQVPTEAQQRQAPRPVSIGQLYLS